MQEAPAKADEDKKFAVDEYFATLTELVREAQVDVMAVTAGRSARRGSDLTTSTSTTRQS
eukprot:762812-Hanusia_phi.AAC.4